MLVVYLHTLQTVNFLDLIYNILLDFCGPFYCKNIRRCNGTVGKWNSSFNIVILLNKNLF